jgi:5'-nucleotidase
MKDYFKNNSPVSPPEEVFQFGDNADIGLLQVGKSVQAHKLSDGKLGTATADIDGEKASCRDHDCAYGTLLCQELLSFAQSEKPNSNVKVALYNGGGIRASIAAGDVTEEHVMKVHPFGNEILVTTVPGSAIQKMVETALLQHGAPGTGAAGNWLQTAGMSFKASWNGTSWALKSIDVGGQPLDGNTEYAVVTNKYIMDGNGGREAISSAAKSTETLSKTVAELMKDYFKNNSPVSPPEELFQFGTSQ